MHTDDREVMVTCLYKLRLYRCGVDSLVVEEGLHLLGNSHVVAEVEATDVRRRYDTIARQLPYVELVHGKHPLHLHPVYTINIEHNYMID